MTEEQRKNMIQHMETGQEQKKEILEQGKAFHQQLLFCSTTVFSVVIAFNQQKYSLDSYVFLFKISTLTLLLLTIISLTLRLYHPFRTISKVHEEYMAKLQEKLRNPATKVTVIVQPTKIEKFTRKFTLTLFILSMLSLLAFGIMSSIEQS